MEGRRSGSQTEWNSTFSGGGLERRGRRGRWFISAIHTSLWQKVEKKVWTCDGLIGGKTDKECKGKTLPVRDWEKEGLTVLFCPLTWDKNPPVATFPFIYNSHPKKRMISNMDYSTSAAACWMNALNPNSKCGNASFHEALRVQKITCHAEDRTALINRQWISLMNFSQHDGNSALTASAFPFSNHSFSFWGGKSLLSVLCHSTVLVRLQKLPTVDGMVRSGAAWEQSSVFNVSGTQLAGSSSCYVTPRLESVVDLMVCVRVRECSAEKLDLPYRVVSAVAWL